MIEGACVEGVGVEGAGVEGAGVEGAGFEEPGPWVYTEASPRAGECWGGGRNSSVLALEALVDCRASCRSIQQTQYPYTFLARQQLNRTKPMNPKFYDSKAFAPMM